MKQSKKIKIVISLILISVMVLLLCSFGLFIVITKQQTDDNKSNNKAEQANELGKDAEEMEKLPQEELVPFTFNIIENPTPNESEGYTEKAGCFDEGFDPVTSQLPDNSFYEEINISDNLRIKKYSLSCGYAETYYVYEILKSGSRQALLVNLAEPSYGVTPILLDEAGSARLFFPQEVKTLDGKWVHKHFIYDINTNKVIELPNYSCLTWNSMWSKGRLITTEQPHNENLDEDGDAKSIEVCVWSAKGELLNTFSLPLTYLAVSPGGYAFMDSIGFTDNNSNIIYVYWNKNFIRNNYPKCEVYLIDLDNPEDKRRYEVDPINEEESHSLGCPLPEIEFEGMNLKIKSNE